MARGWESKSVAEQQEEASQANSKPHARLTHEQASQLREKQGLLLVRQRVLQQIDSSRDPRHRKMLEQALADLDLKLAKLAG